MSRYTDVGTARQHLTDRLMESALNNVGIKADAAEVFCDIAENRLPVWIDELQTYDAREVRNGMWIHYAHREPQYDISGVKTWGEAYQCSNCGFIHSVIEDFGHYAYCPNCGAKIVGVWRECEICPIAQNTNLEDDDSPCRDCEVEE